MRNRGALRFVVIAAAANVIALLPAFLLGALSVFIAEDLKLGVTTVGLTVGAFFLAVCLTSIPNGRIVEWLGISAGVWVFALVSAGVMTLFAVGVHDSVSLLLASFAAGVVASFGQLVANLALGWGVRPGKLGLAFGISQSAIPAATFLSGLAVPIVTVQNWVVAFACGAGIALVLLFCSTFIHVRSDRRRDVPVRERESSWGQVSATHYVLIAFGSMFGAIATIPVLTFAVPAAIQVGSQPATSGVMLAAICGLTIMTRIALGATADRIRTTHHLVVVSVMLAVGVIGTVLLAWGGGGVFAFYLGITLALAIGNGWQGFLLYSIVRRNSHAPAAASSLALAGGSFGSAVGPFVFGLLVETGSFQIAWVSTALAGVVAAVFLLCARASASDAHPVVAA